MSEEICNCFSHIRALPMSTETAEVCMYVSLANTNQQRLSLKSSPLHHHQIDRLVGFCTWSKLFQGTVNSLRVYYHTPCSSTSDSSSVRSSTDDGESNTASICCFAIPTIDACASTPNFDSSSVRTMASDRCGRNS